MLKIPSTIFDKKNLSSSRTETKRGRKKKKNYPVYSVQYLAKKKKPQGYLAQYLQQNL